MLALHHIGIVCFFLFGSKAYGNPRMIWFMFVDGVLGVGCVGPHVLLQRVLCIVSVLVRRFSVTLVFNR